MVVLLPLSPLAVACNVDDRVVPVVHEEILRPSSSTPPLFATVVADVAIFADVAEVATDSGLVHR